MTKVLFLQFDLPHFSMHIIPIAVELSKVDDTKVIIGGFKWNIDHVKKELEQFPDHKVRLKVMHQSVLRKVIAEKHNGLEQLKYIYRRFKRFIQSCDAIVSPSLHYCWVKNECNMQQTKLIYTGHGIDVGSYGFGERIKEFDLVLGVGPKWKERLTELDLIPKDGCRIIGYPKFDLTITKTKEKFFNNDNPVFLYNPHFQPTLTSYYKWGMEVLQFFKDHPQYNLIFAPHLTLFNLKLKGDSIPDEYYACDNIHIDLGSDKLTDMTYVKSADVYLGDVSSQVFEFLVEKRPCIFLNAHEEDWENDQNYKHWHFGEVVEKLVDLPEAVASCFEKHKDYLPTQDNVFNEVFDLTETPSGKRATLAIMDYLLEGKA